MSADEERLERKLEIARRALDLGCARFKTAFVTVSQALHALHKGFLEDAGKQFEHASQLVLEGIEAVLKPDVPGVEAGELGPREHGSKSVTAVGDPQAFAWAAENKTGLLDRLRTERTRNELGALGVNTKRISSATMLEKLAALGWDDDKIADYAKKLLETTETGGTIKQRTEVLKLVAQIVQHTEPRALFELKDVDLSDLSEDELDELMRRAAEFVVETKARLQAGAPPARMEDR